jgi:hypothetical protein
MPAARRVAGGGSGRGHRIETRVRQARPRSEMTASPLVPGEGDEVFRAPAQDLAPTSNLVLAVRKASGVSVELLKAREAERPPRVHARPLGTPDPVSPRGRGAAGQHVDHELHNQRAHAHQGESGQAGLLVRNPAERLTVSSRARSLRGSARGRRASNKIHEAMRLNPYHPERFWFHLARALSFPCALLTLLAPLCGHSGLRARGPGQRSH